MQLVPVLGWWVPDSVLESGLSGVASELSEAALRKPESSWAEASQGIPVVPRRVVLVQAPQSTLLKKMVAPSHFSVLFINYVNYRSYCG